MPAILMLSFQDASSPIMEHLIYFHNHSLEVLTFITAIVIYHMSKITSNSNLNATLIESHTLEMFWTVSPSVLLMLIGLPSIKILYNMDESFSPVITLKTMGHQWYWTYEFSDFTNIPTDSYLGSLENKTPCFRLLEVDNRLILPLMSQLRNLVSADDVLHSWAVPSLSASIDAVPGRLNQIHLFIKKAGLSFGQCSEICGANHSFMPICLESVTTELFLHFLSNL